MNPKGYAAYIAKRIGQAALVLWAAYTVTYVILNLLPKNVEQSILVARGMQEAVGDPNAIAQVRAEFGLDESPVRHYFTVLFAALHGDLGTSYQYGSNVASLIATRLGMTISVSLLAVLLAVAVAFVLAFAASYFRQKTIRAVLQALPTLSVSVPTFWIGLLLMQVFSFWLGLLPSIGQSGWKTMVLPVITMAIPVSAMLSRLLMDGFDNVLREPFIVAAKAHGFSRRSIIVSHVIKNGSLPALTMLGLIVGGTVNGAIVAETVFSRQGVGLLIQQAVQNQDFPVVQGVVLLAAAAFVVVNLVVDLIYPLLDPRISQTSKEV